MKWKHNLGYETGLFHNEYNSCHKYKQMKT